jgi:hypothetical protein
MRTLFRANRFTWLMLAAVLITALRPAQMAGGAISGTVSGPTGVAVPNAQVSVQNAATHDTGQVTTSQAGVYSVPNLTPGTYQATISAPGFSTLLRSNLEVSVGSELVVNLQLQLGSTQQTIEVKGAPPQVDAASSSTGAVVAGPTVRQLPLNGRDWTSLAALQPGVSVVHTLNAPALNISRSNRGLRADDH